MAKKLAGVRQPTSIPFIDVRVVDGAINPHNEYTGAPMSQYNLASYLIGDKYGDRYTKWHSINTGVDTRLPESQRVVAELMTQLRLKLKQAWYDYRNRGGFKPVGFYLANTTMGIIADTKSKRPKGKRKKEAPVL